MRTRVQPQPRAHAAEGATRSDSEREGLGTIGHVVSMHEDANGARRLAAAQAPVLQDDPLDVVDAVF